MKTIRDQILKSKLDILHTHMQGTTDEQIIQWTITEYNGVISAEICHIDPKDHGEVGFNVTEVSNVPINILTDIRYVTAETNNVIHITYLPTETVEIFEIDFLDIPPVITTDRDGTTISFKTRTVPVNVDRHGDDYEVESTVVWDKVYMYEDDSMYHIFKQLGLPYE